MVSWSRNYDEFVTRKYGKEYLDSIRTTDRYYFLTKEGIKFLPYFCYRFDIKSVIDYGAGYHSSLEVPDGVTTTYYDPYVKKISKPPENPADLVVLYNVINGIERDYLEEFIDEVRKVCSRYLICTLRTPGFYGVKIETYRDKFLKRGFKILEEHRVTLEEFFNSVDEKDAKLPAVKGELVLNEAFFILLEIDPNF
jgi:hypothetical protein